MKVFLKTAISLLLIVFLWSVYELVSYKKEYDPLHVTYKVISYSSKPYKVTIGYRTEHGMIFVDTTDKRWTANACLPVGVSANIVAYPVSTLDSSEQDTLDSERPSDNNQRAIITQIISKTKTISDYSHLLSICCLTPMEGN